MIVWLEIFGGTFLFFVWLMVVWILCMVSEWWSFLLALALFSAGVASWVVILS